MKNRLCLITSWRDLASAARYDASTLAALAGVSLRQLERHLHRVFGFAPQKWLNEARLDDALGLLLEHQRVKEVAWELGFSDASHFIRHFKRRYNTTPLNLLLSRALDKKHADEKHPVHV